MMLSIQRSLQDAAFLLGFLSNNFYRCYIFRMAKKVSRKVSWRYIGIHLTFSMTVPNRIALVTSPSTPLQIP